MRIVLYADNTLPLQTEALCAVLNAACQTLRFHSGMESFRINGPMVSSPETYKRLNEGLREEAAQFDMALLATSVPYDNNYFFEGHESSVIISFHGWQMLTDLPVTNGFVYFIAAVLCQTFDIGYRHEENTGCLNDLWWNKTGVDAGMRAAFLCSKCKVQYHGDRVSLDDIVRILDLVSIASRGGKDVLNVSPAVTSRAVDAFDTFLCYNDADKPIVREINTRLKTAGLSTWLDEEQLPPGRPWQPELERQIAKIRSASVFVGPSGTGPWQSFEIRAFLSEFLDRSCPVIPVLLPDAPKVPELPIFLKQMTWVDLRRDYEKNFLRLVAALHRRGAPT